MLCVFQLLTFSLGRLLLCKLVGCCRRIYEVVFLEMLVRKYGLGISIDVKLLISLIQFSHWSSCSFGTSLCQLKFHFHRSWIMIFALTIMHGFNIPRGSNNFDAKLTVDLSVSVLIASDFLMIFPNKRHSMSFVEFHVIPGIFVI